MVLIIVLSKKGKNKNKKVQRKENTSKELYTLNPKVCIVLWLLMEFKLVSAYWLDGTEIELGWHMKKHLFCKPLLVGASNVILTTWKISRNLINRLWDFLFVQNCFYLQTFQTNHIYSLLLAN